MSEPTRRNVLSGAGAALGGALLSPRAALAQGVRNGSLADLNRYVAFGNKASGGAGDEAAGAWMEAELRRAGYAVARRSFTAPFFEVERATLSVGDVVASVLPQAIVVTTPAGGVTGRLRRVAPGVVPSSMEGEIALVDLPHGRWSSATAKPIRDTVGAAFGVGAIAAMIVTNGPTGKAIALNADGRKPMFERPVAVLAPADARPFLSGASDGREATLVVAGRSGRLPAFNLSGRIDRGRGRWLVVSTPRSGWTTCGGERGGGVAAWLALARWAPLALDKYDLAFLCNSGHEYEYLGAEHAMETAPPPSATAMWLHLGANVAARDWQELTGTLLPLPSSDPQRYLVVSPSLIDDVRRLFAGQPGLEAPRATGSFAAGELTNVIGAGYPTVLGIFGAHRYHHVEGDAEPCIEPGGTDKAIAALKQLLLR